MFSRGATTHHKADVFALGSRGALLGQLDSPAVIPHIEESKGGRFHYEARGCADISYGGDMLLVLRSFSGASTSW